MRYVLFVAEKHASEQAPTVRQSLIALKFYRTCLNRSASGTFGQRFGMGLSEPLPVKSDRAL
jgi:hypothetical protein